MIPPDKRFPRTLALINEAIIDAVAELLVGASDDEIMRIAAAKNINADQLAEEVRAKLAAQIARAERRKPTNRAEVLAMSDNELIAYAVANGIDADADVTRLREDLARTHETPQERYVREHGKVYPEPGMIDHTPIKRGHFGLLPSKLPCVECPLTRASIPGRLGGYTVGQYLDILHSHADIACHLSEGFPNVLETQRSCTGVAMYRANCGITAWGHAREATEAIGKNTELSFANPREFVAHHAGKKP